MKINSGKTTLNLTTIYLVVMHLTGVETFQLPTREQVLYLGLNGLIGTVSKNKKFGREIISINFISR